MKSGMQSQNQHPQHNQHNQKMNHQSAHKKGSQSMGPTSSQMLSNMQQHQKQQNQQIQLANQKENAIANTSSATVMQGQSGGKPVVNNPSRGQFIKKQRERSLGAPSAAQLPQAQTQLLAQNIAQRTIGSTNGMFESMGQLRGVQKGKMAQYDQSPSAAKNQNQQPGGGQGATLENMQLNSNSIEEIDAANSSNLALQNQLLQYQASSQAQIGSSRKQQKIQIHLKNNRFHNRKASGPAALNHPSVQQNNLQHFFKNTSQVSQDQLKNHNPNFDSRQQVASNFLAESAAIVPPSQQQNHHHSTNNRQPSGQKQSSNKRPMEWSGQTNVVVSSVARPQSKGAKRVSDAQNSSNGNFARTFFHPPNANQNHQSASQVKMMPHQGSLASNSTATAVAPFNSAISQSQSKDAQSALAQTIQQQYSTISAPEKVVQVSKKHTRGQSQNDYTNVHRASNFQSLDHQHQHLANLHNANQQNSTTAQLQRAQLKSVQLDGLGETNLNATSMMSQQQQAQQMMAAVKHTKSKSVAKFSQPDLQRYAGGSIDRLAGMQIPKGTQKVVGLGSNKEKRQFSINMAHQQAQLKQSLQKTQPTPDAMFNSAYAQQQTKVNRKGGSKGSNSSSLQKKLIGSGASSLTQTHSSNMRYPPNPNNLPTTNSTNNQQPSMIPSLTNLNSTGLHSTHAMSGMSSTTQPNAHLIQSQQTDGLVVMQQQTGGVNDSQNKKKFVGGNSTAIIPIIKKGSHQLNNGDTNHLIDGQGPLEQTPTTSGAANHQPGVYSNTQILDRLLNQSQLVSQASASVGGASSGYVAQGKKRPAKQGGLMMNSFSKQKNSVSATSHHNSNSNHNNIPQSTTSAAAMYAASHHAQNSQLIQSYQAKQNSMSKSKLSQKMLAEYVSGQQVQNNQTQPIDLSKLSKISQAQLISNTPDIRQTIAAQNLKQGGNKSSNNQGGGQDIEKGTKNSFYLKQQMRAKQYSSKERASVNNNGGESGNQHRKTLSVNVARVNPNSSSQAPNSTNATAGNNHNRHSKSKIGPNNANNLPIREKRGSNSSQLGGADVVLGVPGDLSPEKVQRIGGARGSNRGIKLPYAANPSDLMSSQASGQFLDSDLYMGSEQAQNEDYARSGFNSTQNIKQVRPKPNSSIDRQKGLGQRTPQTDIGSGQKGSGLGTRSMQGVVGGMGNKKEFATSGRISQLSGTPGLNRSAQMGMGVGGDSSSSQQMSQMQYNQHHHQHNQQLMSTDLSYPGSSGIQTHLPLGAKQSLQLAASHQKQMMVQDGGTGASLKRVFIQQSEQTSQADSQSNYGSAAPQSYNLPLKSNSSFKGSASHQKRINMQKNNQMRLNQVNHPQNGKNNNNSSSGLHPNKNVHHILGPNSSYSVSLSEQEMAQSEKQQSATRMNQSSDAFPPTGGEDNLSTNYKSAATRLPHPPQLHLHQQQQQQQHQPASLKQKQSIQQHQHHQPQQNKVVVNGLNNQSAAAVQVQQVQNTNQQHNQKLMQQNPPSTQQQVTRASQKLCTESFKKKPEKTVIPLDLANVQVLDPPSNDYKDVVLMHNDDDNYDKEQMEVDTFEGRNPMATQDSPEKGPSGIHCYSINITEEALRRGKLPIEKVAENIAKGAYDKHGHLKGQKGSKEKFSPRVIEIKDICEVIRASFAKKDDAPETTPEFYRAGKMLGRGAFGKVNLGMHKLTRKLIAIKCINKEYLSEEKQRSKIMHEVNILLKLRHSSVVKLYETFETRRHIMLVMELCAGGDLLNFVRKRKKCDEDLAKVLFKQIIEGLGYIHSKSILHRDIKLDNILLDGKGMVKIADFGVSKTVKKGEMMYEQSGTPAYIAPEIIRDKGYKGFKADMWSAGVVLFALLTGTVPFKANNMKDLHQQILTAKYNMKDTISRDAQDLIRGLLNTDPKKRLGVAKVLSHKWLAGTEFLSTDIFNNDEKEEIRSQFTYNDPSRFNRNEKIDKNKEPWDCFTELNLDSMNQTLRNASSKSQILAPFNSTMSDVDKFLKEILAMAPMEKKKDVFGFAARCRDQDRQYEINNNAELDNGVYHKFVYSTKDSKGAAEEKNRQNQEEALLSRNASKKNLDEHPLSEGESSEDLTRARDKRSKKVAKQEKDDIRAEREALKADIRRQIKNGGKIPTPDSDISEEDMLHFTAQSNFQVQIDENLVQLLVNCGYPEDYVKFSLTENEANYCMTGYYLLQIDQNY